MLPHQHWYKNVFTLYEIGASRDKEHQAEQCYTFERKFGILFDGFFVTIIFKESQRKITEDMRQEIKNLRGELEQSREKVSV